MPLSADQLNRLKEAADAAVLSEIHTGCPALLTTPQWALESGWGSHQPSNNCFGIKFYVGAFGRQDLETVEYQRGKKCTLPQPFATFATLYDCFEKHGELIATNQRYAPAFQQYRKNNDIEEFVQNVAKVYATDPTYANKIIEVMSMPEVLAALTAAWDKVQGKEPAA